jgi:hypothetical protein
MPRVNVYGCAGVPNGGVGPDDEINMTGLGRKVEANQAGNGDSTVGKVP